MRSSRRRRLVLWSLGMGMVAAFIQSKVTAARLAASEVDITAQDDPTSEVASASGEVAFTLRNGADQSSTDDLLMTLEFSRFGEANPDASPGS